MPVPAGGGSPDPSTPDGMVRLLVSDVDPDAPIFTDAEIAAFLTFSASNIRLAAAEALDSMAANEVMVSKVIRTQDLQTDGTKVAAELRARAATLRQQADNYLPDGSLFAMDIVDYRPERGWWPDNELAEPTWCP